MDKRTIDILQTIGIIIGILAIAVGVYGFLFV